MDWYSWEELNDIQKSYNFLNTMQEWKPEQTKMTRQEAILKMPMGFENLPAALETLGLIKFEEEKMLIADSLGCNHEMKVKKVIRALEAYGYKVVKEQT